MKVNLNKWLLVTSIATIVIISFFFSDIVIRESGLKILQVGFPFKYLYVYESQYLRFINLGDILSINSLSHISFYAISFCLNIFVFYFIYFVISRLFCMKVRTKHRKN